MEGLPNARFFVVVTVVVSCRICVCDVIVLVCFAKARELKLFCWIVRIIVSNRKKTIKGLTICRLTSPLQD